jgi:TonB family protein
MYFDFDDHRPDTPSIPRPMSTREVVLITANLHLLVLVGILLGPKIPFVKAIIEQRQQAQAELQREQLERQQQERPRFVFMAPSLQRPVPPPKRAELSDIDRRARTMERAPNPQNDLPFSRGNSSERLDSTPDVKAPPTQPGGATESAAAAAKPEPPPVPLPESQNGYSRPQETPRPRGPSMGILADAIKNVEKYSQKEGFQNLRGGQNQEFGPAIDFDAKGVEFGPWIARFVAQVRRNWFIPMAAMTMRGHVVVTFNVHKDGRITDVSVAKPSSVDAFTISARNAILASNPTVPLPAEYPDEKAFFTVTFFFNENPGAP